MREAIRVEIVGRDAFWRDAVLVEWRDQHPQRKIETDSGHYYLIEADWLKDLERIAGDCFSTIVVGPADPGRRLWLSHFVPTWKQEN
jgi:hypothetical protein